MSSEKLTSRPSALLMCALDTEETLRRSNLIESCTAGGSEWIEILQTFAERTTFYEFFVVDRYLVVLRNCA